MSEVIITRKLYNIKNHLAAGARYSRVNLKLFDAYTRGIACTVVHIAYRFVYTQRDTYVHSVLQALIYIQIR